MEVRKCRMLGILWIWMTFLAFGVTFGNMHLHRQLGDQWRLEIFHPSLVVTTNVTHHKNIDTTDEDDHDDTFLIDRIQEDSIPNPPLPDGNSTMAACLLVMDDNHRLVEWLAYHFHVLPLRYLIVATDPRSRTSPTMVLNRWRRMGMYILEWKDEDYWELPPPPIANDERTLHRRRQPTFMGACARQAKIDNRTWVALYDTDEFLVFSHKGGKYYEASEQKIQEYHESTRFYNQPRLKPPRRPPTTAEPGSMLPFIQDAAAAGLENYNTSCIMVPRILFGGTEEDPVDENSTTMATTTYPQAASKGDVDDRALLVSQGIDPDRLDTLRYLTHTAWLDKYLNGSGKGKGLVDVSRIHPVPERLKVHRPLGDKCPMSNLGYWQSILTLNHYLGSWEAFSFRQDSRSRGERSKVAWRYKSMKGMDYTDDTIGLWIQGFIESVGIEQARALLQGAGLPRGYHHHPPQDDPAANNATTSWSPALEVEDMDPAYIAQVLNSTVQRGYRDFMMKELEKAKQQRQQHAATSP